MDIPFNFTPKNLLLSWVPEAQLMIHTKHNKLSPSHSRWYRILIFDKEGIGDADDWEKYNDDEAEAGDQSSNREVDGV